MNYSKLFEPGKIGSLTFKNRFIVGALGVGHEAKEKKNVMVVGSGPAGLYAAYVAAKRGHEVTVYEAQGKFGGQFRIATLPPCKSLPSPPASNTYIRRILPSLCEGEVFLYPCN